LFSIVVIGAVSGDCAETEAQAVEEDITTPRISAGSHRVIIALLNATHQATQSCISLGQTASCLNSEEECVPAAHCGTHKPSGYTTQNDKLFIV
jgi:hypothetical protein